MVFSAGSEMLCGTSPNRCWPRVSERTQGDGWAGLIMGRVHHRLRIRHQLRLASLPPSFEVGATPTHKVLTQVGSRFGSERMLTFVTCWFSSRSVGFHALICMSICQGRRVRRRRDRRLGGPVWSSVGDERVGFDAWSILICAGWIPQDGCSAGADRYLTSSVIPTGSGRLLVVCARVAPRRCRHRPHDRSGR